MKKAIDEAAQRFKMYERFSRYGESTQEEYYEFYLDELIEFVELFIKQERETCAKVCDERERANLYGVKECAAAIRARGEQ